MFFLKKRNKVQKKSIQYGFQYRDDNIGVIINWYPKKGTVFVQKNTPNYNFPEKCFSEKELLAAFEKKQDVKKPTHGITCDAGTHGNPGLAEFNVTDIDGNILINKELGIRTNNYAEAIGILEGLNYCKKNKESVLWTDSAVSLQWIKSGKIGKNVRDRDEIIEIVQKIQHIMENSNIELRKWDTALWGEIPADFGRK
jgi:ribonuclease HI